MSSIPWYKSQRQWIECLLCLLLHQPTFKFNTRSASVTYRRIAHYYFSYFFFSFAYVNHFSIDQKEPFDGKTDALCYYTNNAAAIRIFFLELGRVNPSRAKENALLAHYHPITNLQIKYGDVEREEKA